MAWSRMNVSCRKPHMQSDMAVVNRLQIQTRTQSNAIYCHGILGFQLKPHLWIGLAIIVVYKQCYRYHCILTESFAFRGHCWLEYGSSSLPSSEERKESDCCWRALSAQAWRSFCLRHSLWPWVRYYFENILHRSISSVLLSRSKVKHAPSFRGFLASFKYFLLEIVTHSTFLTPLLVSVASGVHIAEDEFWNLWW